MLRCHAPVNGSLMIENHALPRSSGAVGRYSFFAAPNSARRSPVVSAGRNAILLILGAQIGAVIMTGRNLILAWTARTALLLCLANQHPDSALAIGHFEFLASFECSSVDGHIVSRDQAHVDNS